MRPFQWPPSTSPSARTTSGKAMRTPSPNTPAAWSGSTHGNSGGTDRDVQQHELPDAEQAEAGSLERAERGLRERRRLLPVEELRPRGLVVLAQDRDRAAP